MCKPMKDPKVLPTKNLEVWPTSAWLLSECESYHMNSYTHTYSQSNFQWSMFKACLRSLDRGVYWLQWTQLTHSVDRNNDFPFALKNKTFCVPGTIYRVSCISVLSLFSFWELRSTTLLKGEQKSIYSAKYWFYFKTTFYVSRNRYTLKCTLFYLIVS